MEFRLRFLDQAIEERLYLESAEILNSASWEDFWDISRNLPLYIFGSGEGTEYFFEHYGEIDNIAGVLDNDSSKWGKGLKEYISYPLKNRIVISSPDVIEGKENAITVLITSIRYCDDIYSQLLSQRVKHIYSLLHMEAKRRNKESKNGDAFDDERLRYAEDCVKLPIKNNKILLARDGLAGHGKQIFKKLAQINLDLDLVWIVEKGDVEHIPGVRIIKQSNWREYLSELETAKLWIFGDMIPEYAIKRPEQVYIHVKHWASITLKSFYFHLKKHLETKSIYDYYRHNSEAMDWCMVGSDFDEITCRSGFDFNGGFIRVGSPRSDVLFQQGIREKVYKMIGLDYNVHTVLYAPTFRSKNNNSLIGHMRDVDLDFELLKNTLEKKFGGDWAILIRIHPDVASESRKIKKREYVHDVSNYTDSEELVAATDIMISDYSSIMFEPAFVNKPVFLYSPDADEYIANDREMLIDYYTLPFSISKSNAELSDNIKRYNYMGYKTKVEDFLSYYGVREDGNASERAAKFIINILFDKEE